MATREIPRVIEYICDRCGNITESHESIFYPTDWSWVTVDCKSAKKGILYCSNYTDEFLSSSWMKSYAKA